MSVKADGRYARSSDHHDGATGRVLFEFHSHGFVGDGGECVKGFPMYGCTVQVQANVILIP
jgi:hypothetical protein